MLQTAASVPKDNEQWVNMIGSFARTCIRCAWSGAMHVQTDRYIYIYIYKYCGISVIIGLWPLLVYARHLSTRSHIMINCSSPFQGLVPSHISCINGGTGSQRYTLTWDPPTTNCVLRQLACVPAIETSCLSDSCIACETRISHKCHAHTFKATLLTRFG